MGNRPFKKKVYPILGKVETLEKHKNIFQLSVNNQISIQVKNIILAIGSEAKELNYLSIEKISVAEAMDKQQILRRLQPDDCIAVFGSSHTAVLVLRNLVESKVKRIINFYRSPLRYAVYLDNWILFDDTGLKGSTAEWARAHLDGHLPPGLLRVHVNEDHIEHYLPQCNKVVYAIGFTRRSTPVIKNEGPLTYLEQCGIIAPGLFGVGIAFPEAKMNPFGMTEKRVGLWKFMEYLHAILPVWLKYSA